MRLFSALCVLSLFTAPTAAENWPHWRGPVGNCVAPGANPPTEWSTTKNIKWKVELSSRENSSPIIWDDQVFVVATEVVKPGEGEQLPLLAFNLLSFDRETGNLRWKQTATTARPHQGVHATTGFAAASPCTDGERIYAHFGSRGIYCFTLDGQPVWKRDDLGQMTMLNNFGEGASPTLSGDAIIVPWDHQEGSKLFVFNKLTGETLWQIDRDEPTGWCTPVVVEHGGRSQVIMNGQNFARAYDLDDGRELWRCDGQTVRPICTPAVGDGIVYVCSGFQGDFMAAFRLDGSGDIEGTDKVAWTITQNMCDMSSPLLSNGRLYFHRRKTSVLSCADAATGELLYGPERLPGLEEAQVYASPIAAGGYVYLTGVNGTTVVIKDAPKLEVVATNALEEFVGGTPAVVDDQLFIRGEKHLFCIQTAK
ncbi:MAG: PQQ-like beta-propeller repeat protein [Planctomycetaceae bacterium]|nr:PQQ-like beta-propeller repeat protein [Planctomycetaceae bacterium]